MLTYLYISGKLLLKQKYRFILTCVNLILGCILLTVFFGASINLMGFKKQLLADKPDCYQLSFRFIPWVDGNREFYNNLTSRKGVVDYRAVYETEKDFAVIKNDKNEILFQRVSVAYYGGSLLLKSDIINAVGPLYVAGREAYNSNEAVISDSVVSTRDFRSQDVIGMRLVVPEIIQNADGTTNEVEKEYVICGVISTKAQRAFDDETFSTAYIPYKTAAVYSENIKVLTVGFNKLSQVYSAYNMAHEYSYMYLRWSYLDIFLTGCAIDFAIAALIFLALAIAFVAFVNLKSTLNSITAEITKSYALLKIFGYQDRQNSFIVYAQSLIMLLCAAVITLPASIGICAGIVNSMKTHLFGVSLSLIFTWSVLGYILALVFAALIAFIYTVSPAKKIKKISLLQAVK